MKTNTLFLAVVALAVGAGVPARSQDYADAALNRMVSWVSNAANALGGPSCDDPAGAMPLNYAEDTCCDDGCCGCCGACCHRHDVWATTEFLMWWGKGTPLPPLVTTSPQGTPQASAGILGLPTTTTLFGNQLASNKLQGGGRVAFGLWLDPEHNVTAGGRFFGLGGDTSRFNQFSGGNPILARPFFDTTIGAQNALLVAYPGFSTGRINAYNTTNNIIGAEAFGEIMMTRDQLRRIDLVGGYQFFRLDDWLQVTSNSTRTSGLFPGLNQVVSDRFSTQNQFHGGEFGLRGRMARGMWSLNVLGLLGLGNMLETATISGTTTTTLLGATSTTPHGLLTQPSNIGTFQQNKFCFIPQLTANLNFHVNQNMSVFIGYNMMWLSNVALSGEQVDLTINRAQPAVGPNRPAFVFHDENYWLQGINWGMSWDF